MSYAFYLLETVVVQVAVRQFEIFEWFVRREVVKYVWPFVAPTLIKVESFDVVPECLQVAHRQISFAYGLLIILHLIILCCRQTNSSAIIETDLTMLRVLTILFNLPMVTTSMSSRLMNFWGRLMFWNWRCSDRSMKISTCNCLLLFRSNNITQALLTSDIVSVLLKHFDNTHNEIR